jgi:hypothetical protein
MLPPFGLLMRTMLGQLHAFRFSDVCNIVHGFRQFRVESLPPGLFPLHLETTLHGLPHRLNCGGLKDLALSQWTDHALTMRAWGLGLAAVRQVFLDEPFGHGLSIGVVGIGIQLAFDGFDLIHPDVGHA